MKIQLVNSPLLQTNRFGEFFTNNWPPLGLLYLASYLKANFPGQLKIKLTDGVLLGKEKTLEEVLNFAPEVLGISMLTSTSTGGYELINKVKGRLPQTFVVCGGVHASALPEEVYQLSKTNLVAIGEGEQTLLEIVNILKNGDDNFQSIPGLALFKNGQALRTRLRQFIPNLDTLPFPAHDLLEFRNQYNGWFFQKQKPETIIISTRGCPFNCFFCTDVIWKSAKPYLRVRSPQNIVKELRWLSKTYGIKEYFDMADEFNCLEGWAIEVCRQIKKSKLGLTWKCQLRADKVSENLAKNLAEAGCWYVHLGVESGNQETLDGVGKKITLEQVEQACQNLKKYNLKINLLLMLFNIWEEKGKLAYEGVRESLQTLRFARRLIDKGLADFFGWSPTTPYPGAPLYNFSLKHQLISPEICGHWEKWNNVWGVSIDLPTVSRTDYTKVKLLGVIWQSWYFFRKMGYGINLGTIIDLTKRILAIFVFSLNITRDWLFSYKNDILPAHGVKPRGGHATLRGKAGFPFRKTDDVFLPASSPPMKRRGIRRGKNKKRSYDV